MKKIILGLLTGALSFAVSAQGITKVPISFTPNSSVESHHHEEGEMCLQKSKHLSLLQTDGRYAQGIADAHSITQTLVEQYEANGTPKSVMRIPVVFHVIHKGEAVGSGTNISDAQLLSAIDALNRDFAATSADGGVAQSSVPVAAGNTNIQFCLASTDPNGNPTTGINRVNGTSVTGYSGSGITSTNEVNVKNLSRWDNRYYMNVWVVSEIDDNGADLTNPNFWGGGTLGYAYLPTNPVTFNAQRDGIVVVNLCIGNDPANNQGFRLWPPTRLNRTLTHEVGHYLNLLHTFEGESCSESNCSTQGDFVCDTPPTVTQTNCGTRACSNTQQVENYMDYTGDACYDMFSQGQATRMTAVLTGVRNALINTNNCTPLTPQPPVADFVANQTTVAPGTTVNFTDLSANLPTGWTWSVSPGAGWTYAGGTNANSQNPQITFNTLGQYTVSLLASNAEGSDTETKTNYINVVESTGPCAAASTNNPACDEYISNVTLQGINNTTGCTTYSDFTSQSTNLTKGEQYTVTVNPRITGNAAATIAYTDDEIAVWIDFNNDGVFNNTTERVGYVIVAEGWSPQFTFTVPTGATTGAVRMRCRLSYQPTDGPIDPCGTSAWGEVEDYTVNIQEPAASTAVTINCGATSQTIYQSESILVPNFVPGATASTTCAGGATSITQSPAAGSQLNPGNNTITLTATDNCGNSSSCTINVTLVNNLSINEYLKESVTVYPNPTSGNVFIDLSKTGLTEFSVSLVDLSGKILSFDKVLQAEVYELDMTDFASGLYQVVVQAGDGLFVAKVAKN